MSSALTFLIFFLYWVLLGAISPVAFVTENLIDIAILVVMSVVVWIFAWSKKKLVNWHGAVMLVSYVAYLVIHLHKINICI